MLIAIERKRLRYLWLLLASCLLIFFDNSRVGLLLLPMALLFTLFVIVVEKTFSLHKLVRVFLIYFFVLVIPVATLMYMSRNTNVLYINRGLRFVSVFIKGTGASMLKKEDSARYKMLKNALDNISRRPFFGYGKGNTGVVLESQGRKFLAPDHMSYLQVWENFGFFAFIVFLMLMLGWMIHVKQVFKAIKLEGDVKVMAVGYNSIFLLFCFAFNACFHPISNEWAEWLFCLIPAGFYWRLVAYHNLYRFNANERNAGS